MRLLSLLTLVIVVTMASSAEADSSVPRVFVPVSSAAPAPVLRKVLHAFEMAVGEGTIRNSAAAQQFERLHSREPVDSTGEDIPQVEAKAATALKSLGSGHLRAGKGALEEVERKLLGEGGDQYRRSASRLQALFDACSFAAMLLSRAKRRADAAAQMEHCVLAYPASAPEGEPEIQPLFDAAKARVPHGVLHVRGDAGCVVRANGIELGPVPLEMTLPEGDYRVQLECAEQTGRIHAVRVGEGESLFDADPLDATVSTRRGLWLRQVDSADADSRELGRLLGANIVLLIDEGEQVRVRADGRDIAVLSPGDDVRPVIPLLEGPVDDDAPAVAATVPPEPIVELDGPVEASVEAPGRSTMAYVAGVSLVIVGAGAFTLGWVFYAERLALRTRIYGEDVPFDSRDRFGGRGTASLGVSAFGAAMVVAAQPFLVSDEGVPAAAWVLAAGGAVLAAVGLGFGLADHCEPQTAERRFRGPSCGFVDDAIFGPLLALHGVPLLALPAMYGLRQWIGGESTVVLGFDGTGGHVLVRGTF